MSCNCNSTPCCCKPKRGIAGPIGPAGIQGNPGPIGPAGPQGTPGGGPRVYGFAGNSDADLNLIAGSAIPGNFLINSNLITKLDSATYRVDQACKLKVDFELLGNELVPMQDIKVAIRINGNAPSVENFFTIASQNGIGLQLSGTTILDLALNDFFNFEAVNDLHVGDPPAETAFHITFNQVD